MFYSRCKEAKFLNDRNKLVAVASHFFVTNNFNQMYKLLQPVTFKSDRGDHRINIEEKKQRSRDNNRSRGGGMGDQRRMGGGDMGRGGRRGGPPMMRRDRQGSRDGQRQGGNYMGGPRR